MPEGWKAELTLVLVVYGDGLLVHRQSPIKVATTCELNQRPLHPKSNVLTVTSQMYSKYIYSKYAPENYKCCSESKEMLSYFS